MIFFAEQLLGVLEKILIPIFPGLFVRNHCSAQSRKHCLFSLGVPVSHGFGHGRDVPGLALASVALGMAASLPGQEQPRQLV